jgi:OOP family OmpA-OmpF porin
MKKGRWITALLGLAAAVAAAPAKAQGDDGLYVGGSIGIAHYYEGCKSFLVPCDDRDTAWRIFGGYRFNRYFSVEAGWFDLGEASGSGPFGTPPVQTTLTEHAEGFDFGAVFYWPVWNQLNLIGRVGVHQTRMKIEQTQPTGTASVAGNNTGYYIGAGMQYNLGVIGLRAEWVRYGDVGTTGATIIQDDVDMFSIGALFRF